MRQADLRTKQFTYDGLMTYNMLCQVYGKVGNGSEVVTGNRNWKWKMETKKVPITGAMFSSQGS